MPIYSGPLLKEDGFIQAEIHVEDNEVVDFEEGGGSGEPSIIIPTPVNAHVHMGDAFVQQPPEGTIEEVVGPGGIKHKALEDADNETIVKGIKDYLEKLKRNGIREVIEYREGGIEGLKILKEASEHTDELTIRTFGRPSTKRYDEWELNQLLSLVDGIGLSAYRDWDIVQLHKIAETVRRMDKPLAMHCSEDVREPIEDVLDLEVHHLVHMIEATEDDLLACAIEDIPIVVCPRSNMHFGKVPNIPMMLEADVNLCLGTDNAMLASPDMFREMEFAYRTARLKGGVKAQDILMMATWNPRKGLNLPSDINPNPRETYLVLEEGSSDPAYEVVTRMTADNIKEIVKW